MEGLLSLRQQGNRSNPTRKAIERNDEIERNHTQDAHRASSPYELLNLPAIREARATVCIESRRRVPTEWPCERN